MMINYRNEVKMILEDALELLEDEESWCQGHMALNKAGSICCPTDDDADRFSISGAIIRTGVRLNMRHVTHHAIGMVQAHVGAGYNTCTQAFNDRNDHEAVLDLMRRAIAVYYR